MGATVSTIVTATATMGAVGAFFAIALVALAKRTASAEDEQIELLTNLLPGNNCGACGMAGCAALAQALAKGEAVPQSCPVASESQIQKLAEALGLTETVHRERRVARVRCGGHRAISQWRADYEGVLDCRAADLVGKGGEGLRLRLPGPGHVLPGVPLRGDHHEPDGAAGGQRGAVHRVRPV